MLQAKALANAIFAYASNIDDLGKLTDAVGIIAQKHVSFQVPSNSYQDVGTELLKSIKEILGKDFYRCGQNIPQISFFIYPLT